MSIWDKNLSLNYNYMEIIITQEEESPFYPYSIYIEIILLQGFIYKWTGFEQYMKNVVEAKLCVVLNKICKERIKRPISSKILFNTIIFLYLWKEKLRFHCANII